MNNITIESFHTPPKEWDLFVETHPYQKIYHLSKWNRLIEQTFRHPIHYVVLKKDNDLVGVFPYTEFKSFLFGHFGVSLPFINYGGPLLSNSEIQPQLFEYLLQQVQQNKLDFIELRLDREIESSLPCKTHKVTFILDLPPSEDELFKSFKAKLRSQIRRPMKEAMVAKQGGLDLLDDFHKIFSRNMRDLGTPALGKKVFKNILQTFPEDAFIVVVYTATRKAVAASFLVKYRDTLEIPWASSLREFNRFSPNMLLYWESMRLAIQQQCQKFDFGRCTPGGGTYRFKKQWGAREEKLFWYYILPDSQPLPEINPDNPKYDLLIKAWQRLPVWVTKLIGPSIIRNIP